MSKKYDFKSYDGMPTSKLCNHYGMQGFRWGYTKDMIEELREVLPKFELIFIPQLRIWSIMFNGVVSGQFNSLDSAWNAINLLYYSMKFKEVLK